MFCKTYSAVLQGMKAVTVQVETDVRNGLPQMQMVGALASEAKEARERVRVAIENSGFRLTPKHITINLSPADIRKDGTSFDLAVAISILAAFGFIPEEEVKNILFAGELSLDGKLNKVQGILPMARLAAKEQFRAFIVPEENAREAALQSEIPVYAMRDLSQVVSFLMKKYKKNPEKPLNEERLKELQKAGKQQENDFSEMIGQRAAKRALMIAAAGGHHLLMIGPPGSGKTALARCMPSIMPELSFDEILELSAVYSISGKLNKEHGMVLERPFMAPHHGTTQTALLGGGISASPGLVSLCHHGVLFLDEFTEFHSEVLETLRQPLEEHEVTISRLKATYTYPASFQLVAAMNPCPCGYYPNRNKCNCSAVQIGRYVGKISQPILDRIDMMIEVFPVEYQTIRKREKEEKSASIREKVKKARELQRKRFSSEKLNCEMTKQEIETYCFLDKESERILNKMFKANEFSTRRYYRTLRLARTIADLEDSEAVEQRHLIEAFSYCNIGEKYWRKEW